MWIEDILGQSIVTSNFSHRLIHWMVELNTLLVNMFNVAVESNISYGHSASV